MSPSTLCATRRGDPDERQEPIPRPASSPAPPPSGPASSRGSSSSPAPPPAAAPPPARLRPQPWLRPQPGSASSRGPSPSPAPPPARPRPQPRLRPSRPNSRPYRVCVCGPGRWTRRRQIEREKALPALNPNNRLSGYVKIRRRWKGQGWKGSGIRPHERPETNPHRRKN